MNSMTSQDIYSNSLDFFGLGDGQKPTLDQTRKIIATLAAYDPKTNTSNPETYDKINGLFAQASGKGVGGRGAGGALMNGLAATGMFGEGAQAAGKGYFNSL